MAEGGALLAVGIWGWVADPLEFEFMQRALLAVVLVAIVSAVVGAFVVVRGMAFIGDALAHASFAGIAASVALGVSIYIGAIVAAVATALGIAVISQRSRLRLDTTIGVLFVGAFALGIVIVSRQENYTADLFSFVFGSVLGVSWGDLQLMFVLGAIVVALVALFYKELLFTSYDATVAAATGIPTQFIDYGLLVLIAISTVVALQAVGIVLVIAMLVTPPATASLLVNRLHYIIILGVAIAVASAVIGLYASYYADVASGATIVLTATAFFVVALLFAPRRGLLPRWWLDRERAREFGR
ncbi:MAG: metal ABC transporter permease [Chloroflexi bacterium]|nr:metal ABC transporter permease [Chloroflexota bacterium]MCI0890169.1 metal ABC transporter permease [Chloroflexota bacterium]